MTSSFYTLRLAMTVEQRQQYLVTLRERWGVPAFGLQYVVWGPITVTIHKAQQIPQDNGYTKVHALYEWSATTKDGELWLMLNPPEGEPA